MLAEYGGNIKTRHSLAGHDSVNGSIQQHLQIETQDQKEERKARLEITHAHGLLCEQTLMAVTLGKIERIDDQLLSQNREEVRVSLQNVAKGRFKNAHELSRAYLHLAKTDREIVDDLAHIGNHDQNHNTHSRVASPSLLYLIRFVDQKLGTPFEKEIEALPSVAGEIDYKFRYYVETVQILSKLLDKNEPLILDPKGLKPDIKVRWPPIKTLFPEIDSPMPGSKQVTQFDAVINSGESADKFDTVALIKHWLSGEPYDIVEVKVKFGKDELSGSTLQRTRSAHLREMQECLGQIIIRYYETFIKDVPNEEHVLPIYPPSPFPEKIKFIYLLGTRSHKIHTVNFDLAFMRNWRRTVERKIQEGKYSEEELPAIYHYVHVLKQKELELVAPFVQQIKSESLLTSTMNIATNQTIERNKERVRFDGLIMPQNLEKEHVSDYIRNKENNWAIVSVETPHKNGNAMKVSDIATPTNRALTRQFTKLERLIMAGISVDINDVKEPENMPINLPTDMYFIYKGSDIIKSFRFHLGSHGLINWHSNLLDRFIIGEFNSSQENKIKAIFILDLLDQEIERKIEIERIMNQALLDKPFPKYQPSFSLDNSEN